MEIKECKSSNLISQEIKQKMEEIKDKIKSNYNKKLKIYSWGYGQTLAECTLIPFKIFEIEIDRYEDLKDIFGVRFYERKLEITIIDQSEFVYPLVKEEFTKFAENNKDSIRTVCFIKDF